MTFVRTNRHFIIQSLLDIDWYKLVMGQFVWLMFPNTHVGFGLKNRSVRIRLADLVSEADLREQLDHVMTLRFQREELAWLASKNLRAGYIDFLRALRLTGYQLAVEDGQYVLTFEGPWCAIKFWEIYALAIMSELKTRAALKLRTEDEIKRLYENAEQKFNMKLERLWLMDVKAITEFGTRRRHSYDWQEWVILRMRDVLETNFAGTSNAYFAMKHNMVPIGTNAHEIPMVLAALARDDAALKKSQYEVLRLWQEVNPKNLWIALPDTFGTTQFLKGAPDYLADWRGFRPDSKKPIPAGDEIISYYEGHNVDPMERDVLFADGLDVKIDGYTTHGEDIIEIRNHFAGRINTLFGWGTNASNDFRECDPRGENIFDAISLVCKVTHADGRPAVKLSDVKSKSTGPESEIMRYRAVFGEDGIYDGTAPIV